MFTHRTKKLMQVMEKKWGRGGVILLNIHQHYQCNIHIMRVVMIFTFS